MGQKNESGGTRPLPPAPGPEGAGEGGRAGGMEGMGGTGGNGESMRIVQSGHGYKNMGLRT